MIFTFEPNLDGRPPSQNLCDAVFMSVPVSHPAIAVLPEALAACPPGRAAPGRPLRLCQGRSQTRPRAQAFFVLCVLNLRVIPVAWLYVSRVRDARSFAECGVAWLAGELQMVRSAVRCAVRL